MELSGLLAKITGRVANSLQVLRWEEGKPLYRGHEFQKQIDQNIETVFRCVEIIADTCSAVPLRLFTLKSGKGAKLLFSHRDVNRRKTEYLEDTDYYIRNLLHTKYQTIGGKLVEILDHPFLNLLRHGNDRRTMFELNKLKWSYERLTGNAYWVKVRNKLGIPVSLVMLHSPWVSIVPDKKNVIKEYVYKVGQEKYIFPEKDIIHFLNPSPNDLFYGRSPVSAGVNPVSIQTYMNKFNLDLFYNRAIPETVFQTDQVLKEHTLERIKERIKAKFRFIYGNTGGRKGEPMILHGGLKPAQLTLSPMDLHYHEGYIQSQKVIASLFGVPFTKFDSSNINANNDVAEKVFARDTILPLLTRDAEKLNARLMTPDFDKNIVLVYDNPVLEDEKFLLEQETIDVKWGIRTRNEIRANRGLEPLPPDQGDVVPPLPSRFPGVSGVTGHPLNPDTVNVPPDQGAAPPPKEMVSAFAKSVIDQLRGVNV